MFKKKGLTFWINDYVFPRINTKTNFGWYTKTTRNKGRNRVQQGWDYSLVEGKTDRKSRLNDNSAE